MGPFHVLLLTLTAPYSKPRTRQVFAIGQYLLFKASAYKASGGHDAVRDDMVEDLPLANLFLEKNLRYSVYKHSDLFSVRMYDTFGDFVRGWRRNFRAGFNLSHRLSGLEAAALVAAMTGSFQFATAAGMVCILATMAVVASVSRRIGDFGIPGAMLFPFATGVFIFVTALAVFDLVFSRPMKWKNRVYQNS